MTVVQLTRWYLHYHKQDQMIRSAPVYGYITRGGYFEPFHIRGYANLMDRIARKRVDGDLNFTFALEESDDQWVELLPEDWPDDVCAEVARLQLLNETKESN